MVKTGAQTVVLALFDRLPSREAVFNKAIALIKQLYSKEKILRMEFGEWIPGKVDNYIEYERMVAVETEKFGEELFFVYAWLGRFTPKWYGRLEFEFYAGEEDIPIIFSVLRDVNLLRRLREVVKNEL